MMDMDLLKLKAFPLTLKDKAKIWLNSLRPRTIRNWAELQAKFLKKFFSAHKTNNLRDKYTPLQLKMVRDFTSARRDSWMPSVHAHTMGLINGC